MFYFFKMRDMRLKRVANDDVYKQQLENHYQMSLFRLCDSTKNADANLSKQDSFLLLMIYYLESFASCSLLVYTNKDYSNVR